MKKLFKIYIRVSGKPDSMWVIAEDYDEAYKQAIHQRYVDAIICSRPIVVKGMDSFKGNKFKTQFGKGK